MKWRPYGGQLLKRRPFENVPRPPFPLRTKGALGGGEVFIYLLFSRLRCNIPPQSFRKFNEQQYRTNAGEWSRWQKHIAAAGQRKHGLHWKVLARQRCRGMCQALRPHYRKAQRVKNSLLRFSDRIGNRRMCADMALRNESVLFRSLLSRNVMAYPMALRSLGFPGLLVCSWRPADVPAVTKDRLLFAYSCVYFSGMAMMRAENSTLPPVFSLLSWTIQMYCISISL